MSPTERLEKAIEKLERLRNESTPGPWDASWDDEEDIFNVYSVTSRHEWGSMLGPQVIDDCREADADLIEVLHRTIDAQLAILRGALGDSEGSHDEPGAFGHALALADAILGGDA